MSEPEDSIAFVRKIARDPYWNALYHERRLKEALVKLSWAKELIKRGEFDEDAERAEYDSNNDSHDFEDVEQFALSILDDAIDSVEHHEKSLAEAYRDMALARTLVMRGNYTEFTIDDVRKDAAEHFKKAFAKEDGS